jgi:hypothetical protein
MRHDKVSLISLIMPLFETDALTISLRALAQLRKASVLLHIGRWAAGRTLMLRSTSKRVKEVVNKMILSSVVCLSRSLWRDTHDGMGKEEGQFVLRQLAWMSARCRITTLELRSCAITELHAE